MGQPTVSIIIPTYNRTELLSRAVKSVYYQTLNDYECLIVDDGSDKNIKSIVPEYINNDERFKYLIHKKNQGASAARNTGLKNAKGNYIAFLDDDDKWSPEKLEKQVEALEAAPSEVGLVYCWMDYIDDSGDVYIEHHPTIEGYVFPHVLDAQRIGGCPTLLLKRTVVEEVGGFDKDLPRGNDGDFIRRVCLDYEVACVPEVLVKIYTEHSSERITRSDETGIQNAIHGHKVKLSKFQKELSKYPKRKANINAEIAFLYGRIDIWSECLKYYYIALLTDFRSKRVYILICIQIKYILITSAKRLNPTQ